VVGEKVTAMPLPSAELLIVTVPVPPVTVTVTCTVLPSPEVTIGVLRDIDIGTLKFAVAVSGLAGITVVIVLVRVPAPWLQFGAHPDARVQLEKSAPGAVAVATRVTVVPEAYQPPNGVSAIVPELMGIWAVVR
jgi:hypothetical protein